MGPEVVVHNCNPKPGATYRPLGSFVGATVSSRLAWTYDCASTPQRLARIEADFTAIANMAGVPALSLPLPHAPGTLPAALQCIGPQGISGFGFEAPLESMRLALLGVAGTTGILQEGARPVLVGALSDAYAWLKTRFQIAKPEDATGYAWRDVHSARFDHVLGGDFNGGTFPVDGSVGTVNVSSASMLDGQGHVLDKWSSTDGSLYRMIVGFDASGQPQAQVNFTRGNDADPASPFFANQQENWISGKHAPLLFHRSDIDAAAVLRLTLHRNGSVD